MTSIHFFSLVVVIVKISLNIVFLSCVKIMCFDRARYGVVRVRRSDEKQFFKTGNSTSPSMDFRVDFVDIFREIHRE